MSARSSEQLHLRHRCCLVCLSSTSTISFVPSQFLKKDNDKSCSLLDRQMSAVYLVSGLLQIPEEMCIRFLGQFGNPEEWATVCDWCGPLVVEGMALYQKIRKLEAEHTKVRTRVRDRMKIKVETEMVDEDATREIRRFLDSIDNLKLQSEENACNSNGYGESQSNMECTSDVQDKIVPKQAVPIKRRRTNEAASLKSNSKPQSKSSLKHEFIKSESFEDPSMSPPQPLYTADVTVRSSRRHIVKHKDDTRKSTNSKKFMEDGVQCNPLDRKDEPVFMDSDSSSDSDNAQNYSDPDWNCDDLPHSSNRNLKSNSGQYSQASTDDDEDDENGKDLNALEEVKKKKYPRVPGKLRENRRKMKPELRKYPLRETLTLQQVIELHKKLALPPVIGPLTKEEREKRRMFQKNNSLAHYCKRHRVKEFPCSTCSQVFTVYKDWNTHTKLNGCEHNQDSLRKFGPVIIERMKCEECDKPIGSLPALENHYRAAHHATTEILNCRGCAGEFRLAYDYQKHYADLVKSNPDSDCVKFALKCPHTSECRTAVRSSEEALQLHIKLRHVDVPQKLFKCIQCNKSFPSKYLLRRHVELHAPKNFKCDRPKCTSAFATKIRLNSHIRHVHESKKAGAPEYPCKFCGKVFYVKTQTSRHEKIHNPETPYLCTVCGKGFKLGNYLTIHMWSHNPDMKDRFVRYKKAAEERRLQKELLVKGIKESPGIESADTLNFLDNGTETDCSFLT